MFMMVMLRGVVSVVGVVVAVRVEVESELHELEVDGQGEGLLGVPNSIDGGLG